MPHVKIAEIDLIAEGSVGKWKGRWENKSYRWEENG